MSYVNSFPLFITSSQQCKITSSIFNTLPRRLNILAPIPANQLVLNRAVTFSIESRLDCKLIINVPTASFYVEVYDSDGNTIPNGVIQTPTQLINTDYVIIDQMKKNKNYYLVWIPLVTNLENAVLFSLGAQIMPLVTDYFSGGIEVSNNLPPGVTSSTQTNGSVLFQFTNVPITIGMNIILAVMNNANFGGTMLIQSSDTTTFPNVSQNFNMMNNVYVVGNAIRSTVFTGTILATIQGVGIVNDVSIIPVTSEASYTYPNSSSVNNTEFNKLNRIDESD